MKYFIVFVFCFVAFAFAQDGGQEATDTAPNPMMVSKSILNQQSTN